VTYGHADYGTYRSHDGGQSWTYMYEGLAVAIAFTPTAIYFGEDRYQGIITRFDRANETFAEVLRVSTLGPYGGGVSDMAVGPSGRGLRSVHQGLPGRITFRRSGTGMISTGD
jgi:hypothetical protein